MSETVLRASARPCAILASMSDCMADVMFVDALALVSLKVGSAENAENAL